MGKGSTRRPCLISRKLEDLRWGLAMGKITKREYDEAIKELKENDRTKLR